MKTLSIVIVTGLSGAGKSIAINALEDAGYFCVDNMPVSLLPKFLELGSGGVSEIQKLALGIDLRQKKFLEKYQEVFSQLQKESYNMEVLFLEASEEVLLTRYSQTRRQHPAGEKSNLLDSIRTEKRQLKELREAANKIIDTSHYTVHELKEIVTQYAFKGLKTERMRLSILSFGFKYGIPLETDLLVDVRFIPNPFFIPELKKLDGLSKQVQQFVKKWDETQEFLKRYCSLLEYLIPLFEKEGKSYLSIAVGCTGGRHRSVTIAEEIRSRLARLKRDISLTHRDIELG